MKKSVEVLEVIQEIKDMLDDAINPIDKIIEVSDDDSLQKSSDEEISKTYHSDNEDEDKWDNMKKACWSGYTQEGMKEKGGRMVPNCVPVKKSVETEDLDKAKNKYKDVISTRKGEPADKELYSRVIAAAKKKFDVYPSAYANGWVVQEYKRRGGTYKVQKSIWNGTFIK